MRLDPCMRCRAVIETVTAALDEGVIVSLIHPTWSGARCAFATLAAYFERWHEANWRCSNWSVRRRESVASPVRLDRRRLPAGSSRIAPRRPSARSGSGQAGHGYPTRRVNLSRSMLPRKRLRLPCRSARPDNAAAMAHAEAPSAITRLRSHQLHGLRAAFRVTTSEPSSISARARTCCETRSCCRCIERRLVVHHARLAGCERGGQSAAVSTSAA